MLRNAPPDDSDSAKYLKQAQGFCVVTGLLVVADLIYVLVFVDDQLAVYPNSPRSTFSTIVWVVDLITIALVIADFLSTFLWLPASKLRRFLLSGKAANAQAVVDLTKFSTLVYTALEAMPTVAEAAAAGYAPKASHQTGSAVAAAMRAKTAAATSLEIAQTTLASCDGQPMSIAAVNKLANSACCVRHIPVGSAGAAWAALNAAAILNGTVFTSLVALCDGMVNGTYLHRDDPLVVAHLNAARGNLNASVNSTSTAEGELAHLPSDDLTSGAMFTQSIFTLLTIAAIALRLSLGNQSMAGSASGGNSVTTTIGISSFISGSLNGILTVVGFKAVSSKPDSGAPAAAASA